MVDTSQYPLVFKGQIITEKTRHFVEQFQSNESTGNKAISECKDATDFATILQRISAISPDTEKARLLHSLTAQTLDILQRPNLSPCTTRHHQSKIAQYLADYLSPA